MSELELLQAILDALLIIKWAVSVGLGAIIGLLWTTRQAP